MFGKQNQTSNNILKTQCIQRCKSIVTNSERTIYRMTKRRITRSNMTGTILRNHLNAFRVPDEFNNHRMITAKLDTITHISLKFQLVILIYHRQLEMTATNTCKKKVQFQAAIKD